MEFQQSFTIFLTFCVFACMLIRIAKRQKAQNLPPGPWRLPLIGNMHQLAGKLPHRAMRDLAKKHGPLMQLQIGELSIAVVSSAEIAKEVMKTHDINFASRPQYLSARILTYDAQDIGFSPYGNYWKLLRKICLTELLSAKRVQSFRSTREEEVLNLIKLIKSQAGLSINLTETIYSTTFGMIARIAFGKKSKHQKKYISVVDQNTKVLGTFSMADLFPSITLFEKITGLRAKLERLHQDADNVAEDIIEEHKQAKATIKYDNDHTEDLVDVLLREMENDDHEIKLTIKNVKAVIMDVFSGGSETAATTVIWAMSEMMKNPKVMERAQLEVRNAFDGKGYVDEIDIPNLQYLKLVIKETLRLHTPAPLLLPRECQETCEINGYKILAKTQVLVNVWAIARDPKYWDNPEMFSPERFLGSPLDYKGTQFEYTPFGAGRRICPGIIFGTANVEILLAMLLYHFDWKLPDGIKHEDLDMTEGIGLAMRRKADLILIPVPYNP